MAGRYVSHDLDVLERDLATAAERVRVEAGGVVTVLAKHGADKMRFELIVRRTGQTAESTTFDERATVDGDQVWAEYGPTHFVARFLEYGTVKMAPRPFVDASLDAAGFERLAAEAVDDLI